MIIDCPNCHAKYQYDEERFERKASKKIRCAKCQQVFEIHNPAFQSRAPEVPVGDKTYAGRTELKAHIPDSTEQSPIPEKSTTGKLDVLQLPAGKRLSLAILEGPDAGSVYRIEKPRVTIGRAADLTLNDSEASRQHAAVEVRDSSCTLIDLGSTNGTLLSGEKILGATELADKSEFQVGATTIMLIVTEEH